MASEFEKTLKKEKSIAVSSPWIHALLVVSFVIIGVALMAAGVQGLAICGICFALAAMALVSHSRAIQFKLNLELVKAIQELQSKSGKGG